MTVNLIDLPWDDVLFCIIFPLLSLKDIGHLKLVCQRLNTICKKYFIVIKNLNLGRPPFHQITSEQFSNITFECCKLRKLRLNFCSNISSEDLINVFKSNPLLTNIEIQACENINPSVLQVIVENCKQLQILDFSYSTWLNADNLQVLIQPSDINLIELSLVCCRGLSLPSLKNLFKRFSSLERLYLNRTRNLDDDSLNILAKSCRSLSHLSIVGCYEVTDKGIIQLFQNCRNLKSLDVLECRLSNECVSKISSEGLKVKFQFSDPVKIETNPDIHSPFFFYFRDTVPYLERQKKRAILQGYDDDDEDEVII